MAELAAGEAQVRTAPEGARVDLLDEVLLALGHRPEGYRKVRSAPLARLRARLGELGLDLPGYLARLRASPEEQALAERLVAVTRTRFFRDRALWDYLAERVLPSIAARRWEARLWSAGTACGAEAYTLALLWAEGAATRGRAVRILATDVREDCLRIARAGLYPRSAVREVPPDLLQRHFTAGEEGFLLAPGVRALVRLALHDLGRDPWPWQLDLLCLRNVCFTYWGEARQREALQRAAESLQSHSWLAIGSHERLPEGSEDLFVRVAPGIPLYRRTS